MTKRNLWLTSLTGGVLAATIVAGSNFLIDGSLSGNTALTALPVGLATGIGFFVVFRRWPGRKGCRAGLFRAPEPKA